MHVFACAEWRFFTSIYKIWSHFLTQFQNACRVRRAFPIHQVLPLIVGKRFMQLPSILPRLHLEHMKIPGLSSSTQGYSLWLHPKPSKNIALSSSPALCFHLFCIFTSLKIVLPLELAHFMFYFAQEIHKLDPFVHWLSLGRFCKWNGVSRSSMIHVSRRKKVESTSWCRAQLCYWRGLKKRMKAG